MAISQIYRMGISQTQMDEVIIGLQDNGTKARLSGTWNDVIGGDGFECIIDYTDVNTQYGALYFGDIYRTTNHWGWSTQLSIPGSGAWCTPYLMDPASNSTLYVGYSTVYKSTNQGTNWSAISSSFGSNLRNMAISTSNTNYIYAATHSNIYRTTTGGGTSGTVWPNITTNLPTGSADITYIAVKDDDADHVWVSMGAYNSHGVYETTNGGTSWSNISSGLPSLPVMCVIQNHDYVGIELYAATDAGVYVMRDGGSWQPFSTGLPNVVVAELEIYYASSPTDNKIYAASFGRGVWSSDLYSLNSVPVADFSGAPTIGLPPMDVNFTDLSQNAVTTWAWDFGDGNTSTIQNPLNTYINSGLYTVSLTVTGPGGSDTETKTDYITVDYHPPTCDFIADVTSGVAPLTVNFSDLSVDSVDIWSWDFGDGGSSTEENPQYDYSTPGLYTVSLTVTGPGGTDSHTKTDYIDVQWPAPVAEFSGFPTVGAPPLMVNFTDASTGQIATYAWNFGDGGTSVTQNPAHQYMSSGVYTVSLTVTGPGGNDTEVKTDYITVSSLPPTADFSGNPISGFFPLLVNFTDLSGGAVNQWRWYFGDGGTSIVQNPAHTYNNSGNYTVSLKAIGPSGSDSIAKVNYITVLVGIEELNTDKMKIYPNPCSEYLMIDSKESVQSIAMADIIGNIVKDELIQCPAPCNYKVNMTDLHQGIYFCRITMEDGRMVLIKILKK
jgi:PKD repeat protein